MATFMLNNLMYAVALIFMAAIPTISPAAVITVFEGATILDTVSGRLMKDSILVIDGNKILYAGDKRSFKAPENSIHMDVTGKTIIPGLFDVHVHIALAEGLGLHLDYFNFNRIERDANHSLYWGVMHVASVGNDLDEIFMFKKAQEEGRAGGATVYTSGGEFTPPGGRRPPVPPGAIELDDWLNQPVTSQQARMMVAALADKGADLIKVLIDDEFDTLPKFSPEIYGAIIDEAHRHNLKVMAHIVELEDAKEAIRRGADALAHNVLDKEVDSEFLALAKQHNIVQITTLTQISTSLRYAENDTGFLHEPYLAALYPVDFLETLPRKYVQMLAPILDFEESRHELPLALKNTGTVAAAGISIALGTDTGPPAHFFGLQTHLEMEMLTKAGLTPMQAIQAATINGANFLNVEDRYGSLQSGKIADFLILNDNPLSDIQNTRKIDSVWRHGIKVDRQELAQKWPGLSEM